MVSRDVGEAAFATVQARLSACAKALRDGSAP
jgi:hypothetical protein